MWWWAMDNEKNQVLPSSIGTWLLSYFVWNHKLTWQHRESNQTIDAIFPVKGSLSIGNRSVNIFPICLLCSFHSDFMAFCGYTASIHDNSEWCFKHCYVNVCFRFLPFGCPRITANRTYIKHDSNVHPGRCDGVKCRIPGVRESALYY